MSFETSFHWLKQDIVAFGEKPGRWRIVDEDLFFLKQQKVRSILSLVEEEPQLENYRGAGFQAHHVSVNDFQAPTMQQIESCMDFIARHSPVYVHCYAGYGRAGTIAAAWLIRNGMNAIDAIRTVRTLRPGAIEVDVQFDALLEYAARL